MMLHVRPVRRARALAPVLLLFGLGACAQVPVAEFNSYREAFQAARAAGEEVLAAEVSSVKRLEAVEPTDPTAAPAGKASLPPTLASEEAKARGSVASHLSVRTAAFDTIGRYNDTLASLAEGKSDQAVGASFNGLVSSVTNLTSLAGIAVPGLSAAAPIVQTFLQAAEKARSRAEFKAAMTAGRPIVLQILQLLRDDINAYEHTERALVYRELDTVEDDMMASGRSMALLAQQHKEPATAALRGRKEEAAKKLTVAITAFEPEPPAWLALPGTPEAAADYDELVQSQLDQFATRVVDGSTRRTELLAHIEDQQAMLRSYQSLLDATMAAIDRVQAKLDAPPDLTAIATEIATLAVTVRSQVKALGAL